MIIRERLKRPFYRRWLGSFRSSSRANDLYRRIIERLEDYAIFTIDLDGAISSWNQGAVKIFGYSDAEIIGQPFERIFTPEDVSNQMPQKELANALENGRTSDERWHVRKGGDLLWANGLIFSLADSQGKSIGFVKVVRDRTELKRTEECLWSAKEYYRILLASAAEFAIITLDTEGRVTIWNPGAKKIFGYDESDAVGRTNEFLFLPQDRESGRPQKELKLAREEGRAEHELWMARKDGGVFWASGSMMPLRNSAGRLIGFIKILRDATDKKLAVEELDKKVASRTARLQQINEELESFTYSASHDLRGPLRKIEGYGQIILERHASRLDPKAVEYLRNIRAATQTMNELIDDMLSLARVTQRPLHQEEFDLTEVAARLFDELEKAEPDRKVSWSVAPGMKAIGDRHLIGIAVRNLLDNAWKFTSKTPEAAIEMGQTEIEGRKAFFVRDNGVGFDPGFSDKIFRAFERLHAQEDFPGTGIGLAIVRRVILRHDGRIWAESSPGRGATFYFTLYETK